MLYSIDELTRGELKLSRSTILRLIEAGRLERVKIGRRALVTAASVKKLIAEGKREPGP